MAIHFMVAWLLSLMAGCSNLDITVSEAPLSINLSLMRWSKISLMKVRIAIENKTTVSSILVVLITSHINALSRYGSTFCAFEANDTNIINAVVVIFFMLMPVIFY